MIETTTETAPMVTLARPTATDTIPVPIAMTSIKGSITVKPIKRMGRTNGSTGSISAAAISERKTIAIVFMVLITIHPIRRKSCRKTTKKRSFDRVGTNLLLSKK